MRRRTPRNVVGLSEQRPEDAHDAQEDDDPDDDDGDQRKIRNQNQPLGPRGLSQQKGGNLRPNRTAAGLISRHLRRHLVPCSPLLEELVFLGEAGPSRTSVWFGEPHKTPVRAPVEERALLSNFGLASASTMVTVAACPATSTRTIMRLWRH
jgi:hypothetical protein